MPICTTPLASMWLFNSTWIDAFLFCLICRTVRAISSDRGKVVSGSDDQSVLVWDKQTTQLLEELKGHDGQVCVLSSSFI